MKSWVLFCCALDLLCQFVFTRLSELQWDHPTFPWENEQSEHHGLTKSEIFTPCLCCAVNSVTCMTERVYSCSCSVLMYINYLQLNICTDFALVVPHVIFSALVNKKKG